MTVTLRPTTADDLAFVIRLERDAENRPFIGQWSHAEHLDAIARGDREHWIVEDAGRRLGYAILYDVRAAGQGIYVKRLTIGPKSIGIGRRALTLLVQRALQHHHAEFVTLAVWNYNLRAQRAYRSVGFELLNQTVDERAVMSRDVDFVPDGCLVMILRTPASNVSRVVE